MGLAGRDPIFFAQLASELDTFHPESRELVQTACLGCHGVLGARQMAIDHHAKTGECRVLERGDLDAVPWPQDASGKARYGMLGRDGVSCTACHRMVLGEKEEALAAVAPENACIAERRALLNPELQGFAHSFSGNFLVGPPDRLFGPFDKPKVKSMEQAIGIQPAFHEAISDSEICGSCHTVHLPILHEGRTIGHVYEQTTYPEWAFSAYRTGLTADGPLPSGAGDKATSCQGCHMPSKDAAGRPFKSKIASIQEFSNMPMVENVLGPGDVDLEAREPYALHTLVGLNVFLIRMAGQFPEILGIHTIDPMLVKRGVDPLLTTEQAMLTQAAEATATVGIADARIDREAVSATVAITNLAGHKFPSGVGFRRAFIEFAVLDASDQVLWASGRTDAGGAILDGAGKPIAGEHWWKDDCSARLNPGRGPHQPHYQTVTRQDQAQIYQELRLAPPAGVAAPVCGPAAPKGGELTTSFLAICGQAKDNRLLPDGFLPVDERRAIAVALGAGGNLAVEAGSNAVGDDPDYVTGGGDRVTYRIALADLPPGSTPARVTATLYYQATPPFYLQDRFCTSKSRDTDRLYYLVGRLNLDDIAPQWKLKIGETASAALR